jgi:hypothetical protein
MPQTVRVRQKMHARFVQGRGYTQLSLVRLKGRLQSPVLRRGLFQHLLVR